MKALFSILASFIIASAGMTQTQSTVTINTTGNRNKQIVVDSKAYTISNTSVTDAQAVVISDLAAGQHVLELVRANQYNKNASTKTNFTLRDGYDLTITVSSDGSINSTEKKMERTDRWGNNNNSDKPLSSTAFNKLLTQTKAKTSSAARASFLETEFSNNNKKLTSKQANQLIVLVNSESLRFKLAKLSYPLVTDRENFSLVSNLLSSSANRAALNTYMASVPVNDANGDMGDMNSTTPMSPAKFNVIYNEVIAESSASDKNYYLNNLFTHDLNYYTSAQASQLIQLVPGEDYRFALAKAAFRGVTDRANYGVVSQLLSSSYNRTALTNYINTYDNNSNTVKTEMSTTAFNSLYQTVYYQNSASRFASINTAFTTPGNYFTVAQAKKIIPLVSSESSRLLLAKSAYTVLVDPTNYTQFNEFLISSSSRSDFNSYVTNYDNSGGLGTGVGVAMSDVDFNTLYKSINNSWSTSTRISNTGEAFRNTSNYFTVYQVRQLLLLINSESDRLTLAKSAYDNVVDPANYSQLNDIFTSSASRSDLTSFVTGAQNGTVTTTRIAMTETEFNSIYRDVQLTFGLGAKMNNLVAVFNKETNYFTVAQTKKLIQLVTTEANRLELAKSSFNNVTDRENFDQLYELLSSQSAKNELMAYVNSNAYIGN